MSEKTKKVNPNVIQAIKAVAVLVVICLVCGLLLALCNDLLYVSDEVKLNRAMRKIYKNYEADEEFNSTFKLENPETPYGTVTDVKKSKDGAYVISAKGGGGYKGTITIYLVVKEETVNGKKDVIIKAWTIKEHDGETFLGNITAKHQKNWYVGKSVTEFEKDSFDVSNNKVAGTTLSSTAINKAVKAACYYSIEVLGIASTDASRASAAVKELLVTKLGDSYADYTFVRKTEDGDFDEFKAGDNELSFYFEGTKSGADSLEAYVYGMDDNRQIVVVKAGLTHSERLAQEVVAKSDNATDDVVNKVKGLSYFEYRVHKSGHQAFELASVEAVEFNGTNGTANKVYKSNDGSMVIEATGKGGWASGTVTINVVIAGDEIKGWWIVEFDDVQTYMEDHIIADWGNVRKWFVGESIETVFTTATPGAGEGKGTSATFSENSIINAVNAACAYAKSLKTTD